MHYKELGTPLCVQTVIFEHRLPYIVTDRLLEKERNKMSSNKKEELHHSEDARFRSGNRVYKVVVLGQGGVGKSGIFYSSSKY